MANKRVYGIDVSYYQGVINWPNVKAAGVEWVILRGGYGNSNVDTQFINNITGAAAAGITNIGVYWFSYAHDTDSAIVEVNKCLQTIEPYRQYINMPVWFDWEEASYSYAERAHGVKLTALEIQNIARVWCEKITDARYSTGIYANKTNAAGWFSTGNGIYLWDDLNCDFWYARYGANNETSLFIVPAFESTALAEHPETDILQYSDVGVISGIDSQRVDLNVKYTAIPDPTEPDPTEPDPVPEAKSYKTGIDYVEIRDDTLRFIGIIDIANSVIWHTTYYGVGDFEIYVSATPQMLNLLQIGYYVTRPNNVEVGIIEKLVITDSLDEGRMIAATGRFAKSFLNRRHIYNLSGTVNTPTILRGNVEMNIRAVISDNAINAADTRRNIPVLTLGALSGINKIIIDETGAAAEKQVSFQNLLDYTESVLKEYGIAARIVYDDNTEKLQYIVYEGADRSANNAAGNTPVVFSKDFDNMSDNTYTFDTANRKTAALVGGEGEGLSRFYAMIDTSATGLDRRETWVNASSINKTYKDDSGEEQTYTDAEYTTLLKAQGKQALSALIDVESFDGTIDISNGNYIYNRDFAIGDIVTLQDNEIGVYTSVRISEITEVQDANGYRVDAGYSVD